MTRGATAAALALFALLVLHRAAASAIPESWRLAAACAALVVVPAILFAIPRRRARPWLDAVAAGAIEALAVFSIGAGLGAAAGAGLAFVVAAQPILVAAWMAVLVVRARGARRAVRADGAPAARRIGAGAIALTVALVALGVWRTRAPDFRMDVYDHAGAAARMAARDRIVSHEIGDGTESARPDPRKGTWNSLLAALVATSGAPPLAAWRGATIVAAILGALAFARVSREILGAAWPLGALVLVATHEGGPGGAWFARAAYPGIVGGYLYATFLAETLAALRGDRVALATMLLLAAALPLVHLMAGLFAAIAVCTLACVLWIGRSTFAESRRAAAAPFALALLLIAGVGAWRTAASGPSRNPVQDEIQGVLFLTEKLFVVEPRTLFERIGAAGALGVAAALALAGSTRVRRDAGIAWLVALTGVAGVLLSPFCASIIGPHLGYLMRRVPHLPVLPLPAAAGAALAWDALRARGGWARIAAGAALVAFVLPLAAAVGAASRLALGATPDAAQAEAREGAWTRDLVALADALPAGARVAADPITSYVLYARSLASPLVLPDQHGAPTDSAATRRLVTLARALSPWTAHASRLAALDSLGATHLLVNAACGGAIATFGYPVTVANAERLRGRLAERESGCALVDSAGGLVLYEVAPKAARGETGAPSPENPFRASGAGRTGARGAATSAGLLLSDPRIEQTAVAAGELVSVACSLAPGGGAPPIGDYLAYLAITSEERDANGGRFVKITRGRRGRVVFERMITQGEYPVLVWEPGDVISDRYFIRIPRDFEPGRYVVTMDIQRVPFFQNRTLAGLLGDRDEYARVRVGAIDVLAPAAGT